MMMMISLSFSFFFSLLPSITLLTHAYSHFKEFFTSNFFEQYFPVIAHLNFLGFSRRDIPQGPEEAQAGQTAQHLQASGGERGQNQQQYFIAPRQTVWSSSELGGGEWQPTSQANSGEYRSMVFDAVLLSVTMSLWCSVVGRDPTLLADTSFRAT